MALKTTLEEFLGSTELVIPASETMTEKLTLDTLSDVYVRMKELGINQKQLSDKLGISPSALSKLLSNGSNLRYSTVAKLAAALNCDIVPPKLVPLETESIYQSVGTTSSQMASRTEVQGRIVTENFDKQYEQLCDDVDLVDIEEPIRNVQLSLK